MNIKITNLRGIMGMLFLIHKAKLLQLVSLHPIDQQGSPCCFNFLSGSPSYYSNVTHIDLLYDENIAEAVFLCVFEEKKISAFLFIYSVQIGLLVSHFCHGPGRRLKAMAMWPPCWKVSDHLTEQTRTDMSAKPATGVE